jgi:hypothetical protein
VDPLVDVEDPRSLNAHAYANNNLPEATTRRCAMANRPVPVRNPRPHGPPVARVRAGVTEALLGRIDSVGRQSQPTGWPGTPGVTFSETIGGHKVAEDFTFNGKPHRINDVQSYSLFADEPTATSPGMSSRVACTSSITRTGAAATR